MITSIYLDNFKSLVNFKLPLSGFNALVGLNGSGKSTVLQGIDFLSHLVSGDLSEWLRARQWSATDLNSKLTKKKNIEFQVNVQIPEADELVWSGSLNLTTLKCTQETIVHTNKTLLKVEGSKYSFINNQSGKQERSSIVFDYQGSILSQLKEDLLPKLAIHLKQSVIKIRSLDLLSPELLRRQTRMSSGKLGLGGENLSAFIHETGESGKQTLSKRLSEVYAQLSSVDTTSLRSGWKQLEITEKFGDVEFKTAARHINDGMLRLMAILIQMEYKDEFMLFDEIENGINPELIEFLIDQLVDAKQQVVITTHSPMILNFLEDEIAKQGVIYLYKSNDGITRAAKLFDIPSLNKKLTIMGPGEAFIDTDLTELYKEAQLIQPESTSSE